MSLQVSAVQLAFSYPSSPQEFLDRVGAPVERAARDGAQLVALPDYTGLMLLGVSGPVRQEALLFDEIADARGYSTVAAMLSAVVPTMQEFYQSRFSSLAARLKIFFAPGTVFELSENRVYNTAYLFAPDGTVVGSQRQTHRSPREIAWGLTQGDALPVFDIGIARVGLVVEYPEVSRILALQGANLLIHPAAYPAWHDQSFLLDLWREVQSNQVFGLQACAVGKDLRGKSAVYAPVEMTANHQGILAQAGRADAEDTISATLDFDALQRVLDDYPIFSFFNHDFYAREFPGVYEGMSS